MICPKCQHESLIFDFQVCPKCGYNLNPELTTPVKSDCPHCGADINEGDIFCAKCGAKLDFPESNRSTTSQTIGETPVNQIDPFRYLQPKTILVLIIFLIIGIYFNVNLFLTIFCEIIASVYFLLVHQKFLIKYNFISSDCNLAAYISTKYGGKLLLGWIIFIEAIMIFLYVISSDSFNTKRFHSAAQDLTNTLITDKNVNEIKTQINQLAVIDTANFEKFNYLIKKILDSKDSTLLTLLEETYNGLPNKPRIEILEIYKNNKVGFSTIPILLKKIFSNSQHDKDEYIRQLKTHSTPDVVRELEKDITIKVNQSDEKTKFIDINEEIYFLRNNFSSTNDSVFSLLGSIYFNLNTLHNNLNNEDESEPTKPIYEKPKYYGTVYMYAEYVGPFDGGGMVLRANGKYYLAKNGSESRNPFVRFYYGYYEKTGETITLNRGRNGTECEVIEVKDEETYRDDQRSYQNSVKEAQETYKEELASYNENLVKYRNSEVIDNKINQQISELLFKAKSLIIQLPY